MLIINDFLPQKDLHLFNSAEFFQLHEHSRGLYFQWVIKGQVLISMHFTETEPGLYRSPAIGTYGGACAVQDISPKTLDDFFRQVQATLKARGGKIARILLPPMHHDKENSANQYFILRSLGFIEVLVDLNYSMCVDTRAFSERLNYSNRKRLNKCVREGFSSRRLSPEFLSCVYEVIVENRNSKGYSVSMTEAQLKQMLELFPEKVELYVSEVSGVIAAAAICIRVCDDVLYVFYWGDRAGYSQYSPVVSLADFLYRSCQERNIRVLDAGTSTLDMSLNYGLITFKRGLGFRESLKFRLEKKLDA